MNSKKKRRTGRIALDFSLLVILMSLIVISFKFTNMLLYGKEESGGYATIITKPIKDEFVDYISPGDEVFDHLTKRKIGVIEKLDTLPDESAPLGKTALKISIKALRRPSSESVRTREVFFFIESYREVTDFS